MLSEPNSHDDFEPRSGRIREVLDAVIERRATGEELPDEQLIADHPDLMPDLEDALRDLRFIQEAQAKAADQHSDGLRIRCPHCHNPMEIVDDSSLSDILCPSCGSQFGLTDDTDRTFQASQQEMVNHFQLLDRVGMGAFGSVWSARDTQLDRIVALKIPRKGQLSPEEAEQFIREARAAAQLKHPHIVSVLEVGRYKDRIYIACDFVQGLDLADWLTDQQASPREAAALCATVADALDHAHRNGVIHRDLKPSNIMLDTSGEPYLMDFGLAKRETGEMTMTVDGKLIGTPAYMSPEQARGTAHDADARSDVYSLAVILFELLTGERPFRGSTRMLLHQVLVDDAPSPRKLNSQIPKDLETICLKCLEKAPDRRYQTAAELRDDLQRYLRGEPVAARPISKVARGWRWCKRKPVVAGLAASVVSLLLFVAISAPIMWAHQAALARGEKTQREEAQRKQAEAETERERARRNLYAADIKTIQQYIGDRNLGSARDLLQIHVPKNGQEDLRGWEWRYLLGRSRGDHNHNFEGLGHTHTVGKVQFSSVNRHLISLGFNSGELILWDCEARERIRTKLFSDLVDDFNISQDGSLVGILFRDAGVLELWNSMLESRVFICPESGIRNFRFSTVDATIYLTDQKDRIVSWDRAANETTVLLDGMPAKILDLSEDGRLLVGRRDDLLVWNLLEGKVTQRFSTSGLPSAYRQLDSPPSGVFIIHRHLLPPGEGVLITAHNQPPLVLRQGSRWSIDLLPDKFGIQREQQFALAPKHNLLASGSFNHNVNLWSLNDFQEKAELFGHGNEVWSIDISPDGSFMATGGQDRRVLLWSTSPRKEVSEIAGFIGVMEAVFSPTGRSVAVSSRDGSQIRILDLEKSMETASFAVTAIPLRYSRDGSHLIAMSNRSIVYYDSKSGIPVKEIALDFSPPSLGPPLYHVTRFASSDTAVAVVDAAANCVRVVGLGDGITRLTLGVKNVWSIVIALSDDGKYLAVGANNDNSVQDIEIWDIDRSKIQSQLKGHTRAVRDLEFSPDGEQLASWSLDRTVGVWDWKSNRHVRWLKGGKRGVMGGGISPDGKTLAAVNGDRTVKLWRLDTGREIVSFDLPSQAITAKFSPDGRFLIAYGNRLESCHVWKAPLMEEIDAEAKDQVEIRHRRVKSKHK